MALSIPIVWGILTLLFIIFFAIEDPVTYMVGDAASEDTQKKIREKYQLDLPLYQQYLHYLHDFSPLSLYPSDKLPPVPAYKLWGNEKKALILKVPYLNESYVYEKAVHRMIYPRLLGTMILAIAALLIAAVGGITLGMIAALKKGTWIDKSLLFVATLGVSVPSFVAAVLLIGLFAVQWQKFTGLNATGYILQDKILEKGYLWEWKNLILPSIALGIRPLAVFMQLTRNSLIETLRMDYIRTARAKGLSPATTLFRHALRNALNPVLTSVTGWFASLLAGAFFIEYMFGWFGMGKLTIDALQNRDFPLVMGCALVIGIIFLIVNILTDIGYAWLDPRVKIEEEH